MKDFIEFRRNDNNLLYARIHIDGQRKAIKNPENLREFIRACRDCGYRINDEAIIKDDVKKILKRYKQRMYKKAAIIIVGEIKENMKLSKKRIAALTLVGAITVTGLAAYPSKKDNNNNIEDAYKVEYLNPNIKSEIEYDENQIDYYSENKEIENIEDNKTPTTEEIIDIENNVDKEDNINIELSEMLQSDSFHYSHENRSTSECVTRAKRYEELFEKYAKRYGVDKNLLIAIAAQESSGDHESCCNKGPAEGIMQIEKSVNLDVNQKAYNFETGQTETVYITIEKLRDVETNIQIGAMILQNNLELCDYNIPLALQTYNFGIGNINKVINACAEIEGMSKEDIINNQENNTWLDYRAYLNVGDPNYVENVFSYLPNNQQLTVQKRSGEQINIVLSNDYEMTNQKTN